MLANVYVFEKKSTILLARTVMTTRLLSNNKIDLHVFDSVYVRWVSFVSFCSTKTIVQVFHPQEVFYAGVLSCDCRQKLPILNESSAA